MTRWKRPTRQNEREGTCHHAAFLAFERGKALGYTGLKLLIIQAIARHGGHCWRVNADLADQLGTKYKTSIWRAAHELKLDRILRIVRVLPGRRAQGCERRSWNGTSSKFLDFRRLGCPEAIDEWRRPDTATRDVPSLTHGETGGTPRRARRRPLPRAPEQPPPDVTTDEVADASAAFLEALDGRPPRLLPPR